MDATPSFARPTTAYLVMARDRHIERSKDATLCEKTREINLMISRQLDDVIKADIRRATWNGGRNHQTA